MKESIGQSKYIIHESGLPIRIPPYLRRAIATSPNNSIQVGMIKKDPCIGNRTIEDTLSYNLEENVRLRRIARKIIVPKLTAYAKQWGVERYVVVVHGSVAKGLVRNPSKEDKSDIDIDLIIDDPTVSTATKNMVRETMHKASEGAKIDSYVFTIKDLERNKGEEARYYLRSAAYPLANKGALWEEVLWVGTESQRFLSLPKNIKRKFTTVLILIANGQIDQALEFIQENNMATEDMHNYLESQGLLGTHIESSRQKAIRLHSLVATLQATKNQGDQVDAVDKLPAMWPPKLREHNSVYFT